jgi:hypothetical protein
MPVRVFVPMPLFRSAIAVATVVAPLSFGWAQDGSFLALQGSWAGNGSIATSDGRTERIRCHAKYFVSPSGNNLDQELRCASDSYRFDVNSGLVREGPGSIAGQWTETSRNVTGNVSARQQGDSIIASVDGPSFTASMTVTTRGDSQNVQIVPNGADIKSVTINLRRQ